MTDVAELVEMAKAVTNAVIAAKAKDRELSLPDGWSRERIISNLVEIVSDDEPDNLFDYQDMLDAEQETRIVKDAFLVELPTGMLDLLQKDGLDNFFAQLSDGNLLLVASSRPVLDDIWWNL